MGARATKEQRAAQAEMDALLARAQYTSGDAVAELTFDGHALAPQQVTDILAPHLSERRRQRIDAVLAGRTYTVATVVEGLANTGNVSAVMRSAEALGYQAFHIITGVAPFKRSPRTTQGADKWLDVWHWDTPADCAAYLKAQGYRIAVTHLDDTAVPIDTLDFAQKTAVVFGNELNGASDAMLACSDVRCILPMTGFVQSYNISVAAALTFYQAYRDRLARLGHHGDLSDDETDWLRARFYVRATRHAEDLVRRALTEGLPPHAAR